jgi:hypothetical protein
MVFLRVLHGFVNIMSANPSVAALTGTNAAIDQAIAQFEGFGNPGTLATVNNNPGNIIAGSFATSYGATGSNSGFAVFPDVASGNAAQDALVQNYINGGASVNDLINAWAPPTAPGNSPAATQNYSNFVANSLGISPTTPLNTLPSLPSLPGLSPSQQSSIAQNANNLSTQLQNQSPTATGNPSSSTNAPSASSVANSLLGSLLGLGPGATGTISFGRIGAFVLGLIFIAGGIYLFKGTQTVIEVGTRHARRFAEAGAAVTAI